MAGTRNHFAARPPEPSKKDSRAGEYRSEGNTPLNIQALTDHLLEAQI